jgi:hypothetical protein
MFIALYTLRAMTNVLGEACVDVMDTLCTQEGPVNRLRHSRQHGQ